MADAERFCTFCGAGFAAVDGFPKECAACGRITYKNPAPVIVVLLPVREGGLVTVRRAIDPGRGALALPGGYIDAADATWRHAGAREVREEIGLRIDPAGLAPFDVMTATSPARHVLIFATAAPIAAGDLAAAEPGPETSEVVVITEPRPLAFDSHTAAARRWLERGG